MSHIMRYLQAIVITVACFVGLAQAESPKEITPAQWAQIQSLRGIPSKPGLRNSQLYIFFDPNCPWCARLFQPIQGKVFANSMEAAWIPVTYLSQDSLGKGAALLRSGHFSALENNFKDFNFTKRSGSAIAAAPTGAEINALGKAKTVWKNLGGATPLFVYRDKTGKFQAFLGLPTAERLSELLSTVASSRLESYKN